MAAAFIALQLLNLEVGLVKGLLSAAPGSPRDRPRVHVRGMRELIRDLDAAGKEIGRQARDELREAAEPVARDSERLALRDIRNMNDDWARMRIGVTQRAIYVAPEHRRTRGQASRRPNLAPLLAEQMETALDMNSSEVFAAIERALDDTLSRHNL